MSLLSTPRRTGPCLLALTLLLGFAGGALGQPRTRIAVTAFENKVKTAWWDPSWRIGEGLAEMLTTELLKTGQFIVVERQAVGDVVGEQALGQSGLVRRDTAARSGQMLGAQVVVRGAVTEFDADASGGGIGLRSQRAAIDLQAASGHIAIDLRVIDASSGQVLASHHVARRVPAAGIGLAHRSRSGRVAFGGELYQQTPIGQATREAIGEAVQLIAAGVPRAAPGTESFAVVKVEGATVYINAGAMAGVRVGDVFRVHGRGADLVDPDTGLKLGAAEQPLGSIRITEVQEQFSLGTVHDATGVMKRGDRVRR